MVTRTAEMTAAGSISAVALEEAQLTIDNDDGKKAFPIRDLQSVELRSSEGSTLTRVYIGTIDRNRKSIFSRVLVKREYVGEADAAKATDIRNSLVKYDVPVFELKV